MNNRRLAIVGESFSPGEKSLVNQLLGEVGILQSQCLVVPMEELFKLPDFHPHMILILSDPLKGQTALRAFKMDPNAKIADWRGSLFLSNGTKCLATYHPATLIISRMPENAPVVRFDFKRLAEELKTDELVLPDRNIQIVHPAFGWSVNGFSDVCRQIIEQKMPLSFDIEGGVEGGIKCIGFSIDPLAAWVVPFVEGENQSVWSADEEFYLWGWIDLMLGCPDVPKIAQNSLYDTFVLAWLYGIVVQPISDDTMLKHHELYCELEKSLAFQASIYTKEPFWKGERKKPKLEIEDAE